MKQVWTGAYIYITERCNLACRYCYEKNRRHEEDDTNFKKTVIRTLDALSKSSRQPFIVLFGGEPFLRTDRIEFIFREISKRRLLPHISIITNGTLVTEEVLKRICSFGVPCNIVFSIDGPKKVHDLNRIFSNETGSWEHAMRGLNAAKLLQSRGFPIIPTIRATITKNTAQFFPETLQFLLEQNVLFRTVFDYYSITGKELETIKNMAPVIVNTAQKHAHRLHQWIEMQRFLSAYGAKIKGPLKPCSVGLEPAILPNGDIWPCHRIYEHNKARKSGKNWMGNVVLDVYHSDIYKKYAKLDYTKACKSCKIRSFCKGGCPAINEVFEGSPTQPYRGLCDANITLAKILLKILENIGVPAKACDEETFSTTTGKIIFGFRSVPPSPDTVWIHAPDRVLNYIPPCIGGPNGAAPEGPFLKYVKLEKCETCAFKDQCHGLPVWDI